MKKLFVILAMLVSMSASSQWVNVPNGLSTNQIFYSLAANGDNIFAGADNIYVSTNNGANWSPTSFNNFGSSLLVDGINVYAGTIHGVYISTNNGTNWTQLVVTTYTVWGLAKNGNNIFAGTDGSGVYRSTNNGQNWEHTSLNNKMVSSLAVIGNNIFVGDWPSPTVWRSTNNGSNWDSTSLGAPLTDVVLSLAVKGNKLFAGTDNGGIFVSSNNGTNWTQTGLSSVSINCFTINGNNIFAGELFSGQKGVYLSTNDGANWFYKNQGMGNQAVWSLTSNSQYIFAGTETSVWRRSLSEIIGVQNISTEVPSAYSLKQNYPNPFNNTSNFKFEISNLSDVKIIVYDIMGREVQMLVNERMQPGTYETTFDGSNLNSGVYFYKLMTDGFTETKRMLMIK